MAHLRLLNFLQHANEDVRDAREEIRRSYSGWENLDGLILDLRGNGGGQVAEALAVAELFLEPVMKRDPETQKILEEEDEYAEIVTPTYTVEMTPSEVDVEFLAKGLRQEVYLYSPNEEAIDVPLVVLVDRKSASASEIVTAALRDHRRALIVGETTFGKGIGQSVVPLERPLRGTIAMSDTFYFSPKGLTHHQTGITPDIQIENGEDPFNTWAKAQTGRPSREADYLKYKQGRDASKVVPKPTAFPGMERISEPTHIRLSEENLKKLTDMPRPVGRFRECKTISQESDINEEADCGLRWAVEYLRRLIKTVSGSPQT
jgi:C-terminal processing protease CtpA/Prc